MKIQPPLSIRQTADATGLSVHTLRYYERIGLLDPLLRGPDGHRRFQAIDLAWIEFLTRLRATGMSIKDMGRFAQLRRQGPKTIGLRRRMLENHAATVERQMAALSDSLRVVREKIETYGIMEDGNDDERPLRPGIEEAGRD
jgi:DNA-binding transcriptional MerR regulator